LLQVGGSDPESETGEAGNTMSRRTGSSWDAIAGRRPISRAAASLGWAFADAAPRGARSRSHSSTSSSPSSPRAACDHGAPAGWQLQSTHQTSEGAVAYARCPCGAWLVLLGGQPVAAAHPRPCAATTPVPGERRRSRDRGRLWLWDHGQAVWRWKWRQRRQRARADPR
jgi:hypothetical protein